MKKRYFSFSLLFILIFLNSSITHAQEHTEFLKWFDSQIGVENTRLLNGTAYVDRHRTINNKNKLFGGTAGMGSVLYDGYWFPDLQMRYNIFDDLLIVQLEIGQGLKIVQLVREKVDRFTLNNKNFYNIPANRSNARVQGFHEILFEQGSIMLLKKHALNIFEKRDRQVTYFEFEPVDGHFAFSYRDNIYLIGSRNELEKIFPQHREEIQSYYQTNQSQRRSRPDNFYTNLFRELARLEEVKNL